MELTELAGAVLDGTPIDWDGAVSAAAPPDRRLVHRLKALDAIARARSAGMPERWGPLRLLEPIGRGAFGEVYRAWDSRLDRQVALKLLPVGEGASAQRATSIIEEGRLLARTQHPNVVTIYGAERIDDRVGLWMEYVDGRTLLQLVVEDGRRFSPREVATIGETLCAAVAAVHDAGLLHRDIKAQNVMMSHAGRVVLMDFGSGGDRDGRPGDLAGTPLYLAPEVLSGASAASVQSDIYSLGVLLFFLLTGRYPVVGTDLAALRRAHERQERTTLHDAGLRIPRRLLRSVERAIAASPAARHDSVHALREELAAIGRGPGITRLAFIGSVAAGSVILSTLLQGAVGRRLTGLAGVDPPTRPTIAVFPFTNPSAGSDGEHLAGGMATAIIGKLAAVRGLQVMAAGSPGTLPPGPHTRRQIAEQLGANLVIEGSIVRAGDRLRINAQLVSGTGGGALWTDQFEGEPNEIFSIQDDISRAIVRQLGLTLDEKTQRDTNFDAYDLYLRGRALVVRRGMANAQHAVELFERAIAKDPAFAPAYAGLANAYAFWSFPYRGIPFDAAYPIMRPAAVRALQLDPEDAEAHAAMGWVYAFEREWANADREFRTAIRLNPSLTVTYTTYSLAALQPLQKYDEALRLLQVARQYEPLSLNVQREIGELQLLAGRYREATETLLNVTDVEPDYPFVQTYLARALMFSGRAAEAIPRLEQGFPWLAEAYVLTDRRADAERLAAEWEGHPFRLAIIAAALGHADRAAGALERALVAEPHRLGWLLAQPELAELRNHPRVLALRKILNLP